MLKVSAGSPYSFFTTQNKQIQQEVDNTISNALMQDAFEKKNDKKVSFSGPQEVWNFIYNTIYNPIQYPDD